MAVRITHTNNSQGHDGTYVYRSNSPMDPQNLPAPIADESPVALGVTFEYIDNSSLSGDQYYRTQDYQGGQLSEASGEVSLFIGDDFSAAQVGEPIGGGFYAGIIAYPDEREFHIVVSDKSTEIYGYELKTTDTVTPNTLDSYDGEANKQAIAAEGLSAHPASEHCNNITDGGNSDWRLPSLEEMRHIDSVLSPRNSPAPDFQDGGSQQFYSGDSPRIAYWVNTEFDDTRGRYVFFDNGQNSFTSKTNSDKYTRAIRVVPV